MNSCNNFRIAFIDDGIHSDVVATLSAVPKQIDRLQYLNGNFVNQYIEPSAIVNHGTICTALLIEYLKRDMLLNSVEITSLSIIDPDNVRSVIALIAALDWCSSRQIDLVLMSLGMKSYIWSEKMLSVVEHLKNHSTIVAAAANDGVITYPACFRDVIGVKSIENPENHEKIYVNGAPRDGIEIEAWISESEVLNRCKKMYSIEYPKSNSIMVPYVASKICSILLSNGHQSKNEILKKFQVKDEAVICAKKSTMQKSNLSIVLARYRKEDGLNVYKMLCLLVQMLLIDSYSCACLTDYCNTSVFENSVYSLPKADSNDWLLFYQEALAYNSLLFIMLEESNRLGEEIEADLEISITNSCDHNDVARITYEMVIFNMATEDENDEQRNR